MRHAEAARAHGHRNRHPAHQELAAATGSEVAEPLRAAGAAQESYRDGARTNSGSLRFRRGSAAWSGESQTSEKYACRSWTDRTLARFGRASQSRSPNGAPRSRERRTQRRRWADGSNAATVYRLLERGDIQHTRVSNAIRISSADPARVPTTSAYWIDDTSSRPPQCGVGPGPLPAILYNDPGPHERLITVRAVAVRLLHKGRTARRAKHGRNGEAT